MVAIAALVGARKRLNENYLLMDLKHPFLNEQAIQEIDLIRTCLLAKENGQVDRSVQEVMNEVVKEGYIKYMFNNDINYFFTPYHRIAAKEKEYTNKILQG